MTENAEMTIENEDRPRILLADDEASIRRILETRLKMAGYDVYTAEDGEAAVNAFNKYNPDLVVLDVMKPNVQSPTPSVMFLTMNMILTIGAATTHV